MSHLTEQHYPSVAELIVSARALTAARPDLCALREVGHSRAGRPLHLLSVGHAEAGVLVVAGAHANEPVGGPTSLHLAHRIVHEPGLRADRAWHFLLCADPDGASLHRAFAPRSLLDYHRQFYRPAGPEQPEWAPSVLPADRLPPETRALMEVIDELRPYLQVSLHATDLGGSWVQLTQDIPGLAEPFAKSAAELRIPVETNTSDAVGWPVSGPGVHVMPDRPADALFPSLPEDVTRSTWHHVHRYGGRTAIVEVPMWASDLVDDPELHPAPDEAMRQISRRLRAEALRVELILRDSGFAEADARPLPDGCAPLLRASRWALALVPGLAEDWLLPAPEGASMTYVSSIDAFGRRLPLRAGAMLLRVLREAGDRGAPRLEHLVAHWCDAFEVRFRARWVPLEHQVEHQARTVIAAAQHARVAAD